MIILSTTAQLILILVALTRMGTAIANYWPDKELYSVVAYPGNIFHHIQDFSYRCILQEPRAHTRPVQTRIDDRHRHRYLKQ